jgi:diguanylate cyclase (GGDEF)-like protein/PAS domain S-box-containing protein
MRSFDNFYKDILDNLSDGVYFVDSQRKITYWNKGAERITGYRSAEVIGKSCADNLLVHVDGTGCQLCLSGCPLTASMEDGNLHEAPVFLRHAQGHRVPVFVRVSPLYDEAGTIVGAVESFSDNTLVINIQQQLDEMTLEVNQDALTGIANRRAIDNYLRASLTEVQLQGLPGAILMLDIDHFKRINDTYGHSAGDQVLRTLVNTVSSNLRAGDSIGRWGGEEFLVVLRQIGQAHIFQVAEKLRVLIASSVAHVGEEQVNLTVSVGATQLREQDTPEGVIERADRLLYASKEAGRNRVTVG